MPYTIDVKISDMKLLRSVTLNVSNQGVVPSTKETVMIQFNCSGLQTARVVVDFNLKFVVENSSDIEITFKRKKFCVKGIDVVRYIARCDAFEKSFFCVYSERLQKLRKSRSISTNNR